MQKILLIAVFLFMGTLARADNMAAQGNQGYLVGSPKAEQSLIEKQQEASSVAPVAAKSAGVDIVKGVMKADQWIKDHLW